MRIPSPPMWQGFSTHTFAALAALLSSLPAISSAQYYPTTSPTYSIEPRDEDYSYLKDPTARTDFFDPIKFIPLNRSNDSYLSTGGQYRYRFTYFNNPTFGPGSNDEDGFHLQRFLFHVDVDLGDHLRTYVEFNRASDDGRIGGARPGEADHLDLQQAFVDIKNADAANPYSYLRLGRQELIYGAQRFISPDDWRNVRRTFDGAKFSLSVPKDTIDFFWVRPVLIEKDQFNNDDSDTSFAGIYNVLAVPDLIPGALSKIELYILALNQTPRSAARVKADTYTLGARFYTNPKPLDFDIEADYQFGDYQSTVISAWSVATEAGYTFENYTFTPRASVGADIASGSPDPGHRFNQLFPPTYMYLGHGTLLGRPNLADVHAGVDFHLTRDVTLFTAEHIFWRENTNDAIYNLSSAVVRADNGSNASYLGNEFDAVINWQINRHLNSYVGWSHFFTGSFIEQTGPSKDVDFLYAAMLFTF